LFKLEANGAGEDLGDLKKKACFGVTRRDLIGGGILFFVRFLAVIAKGSISQPGIEMMNQGGDLIPVQVHSWRHWLFGLRVDFVFLTAQPDCGNAGICKLCKAAHLQATLMAVTIRELN
jgi:hypothetical protein